jgi:hypothetical protein
MPSGRILKVAIARRRVQVADLYLQAWPQTQIAEHLGITQSTVSVDLKMIQRQWRESSVRNFDAAREVEIRKIDRVEREAWDAWERSKKPSQEATVEGEGPTQKTRKRMKNQNGDPRYLEIVRACIADRRALLGLDAPTKIAPTTPDGKPLSFEQKKVQIQAILIQQFGMAAVRDSEEQIDDSREYPRSSEDGPPSLDGEMLGPGTPDFESLAQLLHGSDYPEAASAPA